jgi:hypothetical protein
MVIMVMSADVCVGQRSGEFRGIIWPLIIAAIAGLIATLANPYGWGAWEYAIQIAGMKSSSSGIVDEWAATSIRTEAGLHFFTVTATLATAMAMTRQRPALRQLLLAILLAAIGWSAVRLSVMTTVLMVPLLASALAHTPFHDLAFDGQARRFDRRIPLKIALPCLFVVSVASIALARIDRTTEQHLTRVMPVEEVAFMQAHHMTGKILNPPEIGGFLIQTLGTKVSMDTRYDLYGDHAMFEWIFAQRGNAGWLAYVNRLDPDVAILYTPTPLPHLLAEFGNFRPVFQGQTFSVLVRRGLYEHLPTVPLAHPNELILDHLKENQT